MKNLVMLLVFTMISRYAWAHQIIVDGDPSDWTGVAPAADHFAYSHGEAIWADAADDDLGDGGDAPYAADNPEPYSYPTDTLFQGTEADMLEWRYTFDEASNRIYFLITMNNYDITWMPFVGIAMDLDHAWGSGQTWLGGYASLKVDSAIFWEYNILLKDNHIVVYNAQWDSVGGTNEVVFDTANNTIEVGVDVSQWAINPITDVDSVYFVVYSGLQDFGNMRGVDSVASRWNGGGGTDSWVDPNVYDLCFVPSDDQANDLNNYTDTSASVVRPSSAMLVENHRMGVEETGFAPAPFDFHINNVLRNGLSVRFHVPEPSDMSIEIYSPDGRLVSMPLDKHMSAGDFNMFIPVNLRSGIYILRIKIGASSVFEKIAVVR